MSTTAGPRRDAVRGTHQSSGHSANQLHWSINVHPIERARVLNAWTRKHLASVAHVDQKTLTSMCNGRRRPTLGTVQAICRALGLSVADVIVFHDGDSGIVC